MQHLTDEYGQPDTTPARRGMLCEQLGELGGRTYLRELSENPDLELREPGGNAEAASLSEAFEAGKPWPYAVTFGGSRATDIVYFDGETLHVLETKGGSCGYARRRPISPDLPDVSQTDPDHPRIVASEMARSPTDDGRNVVGNIIGDAYRQGAVRYVGVRTGPAAGLRNNDATTVVDRVFLEP
jgi:hypothetical protein